jgi:hypothetical protein
MKEKTQYLLKKKKIKLINDFNEDSFEIFDFFKNKVKKRMKFIY